MKTISSHPLFGYQLEAGKYIVSTSQSGGDSLLLVVDNSVPHYATSPFLLLVIILGVGGVLASTLFRATMMKEPQRKLHDYIAEIPARVDVRVGSPLPLGTQET